MPRWESRASDVPGHKIVSEYENNMLGAWCECGWEHSESVAVMDFADGMIAMANEIDRHVKQARAAQ